ncbi:Nicotinate phosphoribosyltransferase [Thelohanellus kitauei]|uniref:Nicotinate phosphoribosyltransferase n=1 Tax=Thelohanellus kitauei TaxID=669202 RepID=A0A0C2JN30_THEKT|nr:Nicotinate phosphoribosyltransferase [Thelohanellus kitauei]
MDLKNESLGILFNDYYQFTMSYSYWKNNNHDYKGVFEIYFRKNPFDRQFTVFAGIGRFISILENFSISDSDIAAVQMLLGPKIDQKYLEYLKNLDLSQVEVVGFEEGAIVFPNEPLIQISGPIGSNSTFYQQSISLKPSC